jgi:hypothetical protein
MLGFPEAGMVMGLDFYTSPIFDGRYHLIYH